MECMVGMLKLTFTPPVVHSSACGQREGRQSCCGEGGRGSRGGYRLFRDALWIGNAILESVRGIVYLIVTLPPHRAYFSARSVSRYLLNAFFLLSPPLPFFCLANTRRFSYLFHLIVSAFTLISIAIFSQLWSGEWLWRWRRVVSRCQHCDPPLSTPSSLTSFTSHSHGVDLLGVSLQYILDVL
jgi:hypothetical protein